MKRFLTMLAGLWFAGAASASEALLSGSIDFTMPTLWNKAIAWGLDDLGVTNNPSGTHWYLTGDDEKKSAIYQIGRTPTGYLDIETAGQIHRTISVTSETGPFEGDGLSTLAPVYFDASLYFSAGTNETYANFSETDKIVCWLRTVSGEAGNVFMIGAAKFDDAGEVVGISNHVTRLTGLDTTVAHRLTLKACTENSVAGFHVFVDGVEVADEDGTTFYPSYKQESKVLSLGFSGRGRADYINVTRVNPLENPGYDKDDLSMLREAAEITVSGFAEGESPLYNYPVLVRISESTIERFSYDQTKSGGADIRFTDSNGKLLPCEIDTWNPSGESLVWVRVPYFRKGVTITMHWNLQFGSALPSNDSTEVWSSYLGVWHFNESILAALAASTRSKDATGNGLAALPFGGASTNLSTMVNVPGILGEARVNETHDASGGNSLRVQAFENLTLGSAFTLSGWINLKGCSGEPCLFSRKAGATDETGFEVTIAPDKRSVKICGAVTNTVAVTAPIVGVDLPDAGWVYVALSFNGTEVTVVGRSDSGTYTTTVTLDSAPTDNSRALIFGGNANGSGRSLWGNFDEFRLIQSALSAEELSSRAHAERALATETDYLSYGSAQVKDLDNEWLREPAIYCQDKEVRSWSATEADTVTFDAGEAFYGEVFEEYYDAAGTLLPARPDLSVPGTYRVVFTAKDGIHTPLVKEITFVVYDSRAYTQLPGYDRALLMNSDISEKSAVRLQGYYDVDANTNRVWVSEGDVWEYTEDHPFVLDGTTHIYREPETQRELWRFEHVRLGNLFASDGQPYSNMHALPWQTPTARRFNDSEKAADAPRYAGTFIFQNVSDAEDPAVAISPVYTNGVGTVYFDAVNAYIGYPATLQVQVQKDGGDWTAVAADVYEVAAGVCLRTRSEGATDIRLDMGVGGATDRFFRIRAKVNDASTNIRVRIVRTDDTSALDGPDEPGLVILDNILVSLPAVGVELGQYGEAMGTTDLLRGWRKAPFDVPYPTAGDEVHAQMKMNFIGMPTNAIDTSIVLSAQMFGRWRYLNQEIGAWQTYSLHPSADDPTRYVSDATLPFENVGDFEYYFQAICNAPYYEFHDYYELAGWIWPGESSERRGDATLRASTEGIYVDEVSPALGHEFFIRLREGASDVESVDVELGGLLSGTAEMKLVGNHVWRALVQTPEQIGPVSFRFVQRLNTRDTTSYTLKTSVWSAGATVELPYTGGTVENGSATTFAADQAAHYVEFRYNDESHDFSVSRAEYQDFNVWHDANRSDAVFVSRSTATSGVNQAAMTLTNANMSAWTPLNTTNISWNESFELANYMDPGYPKGEALKRHKMPHAWYGYNGQFTDAQYVDSLSARTNSSGLAWQMKGEGYGTIQFNDTKNLPTGLDTLSFRAHLAQSIDFVDFSVWNGDGANQANNYTFFVPALMSDDNCSDLAPGAAMSLVGYYRSQKGGYELRVEKVYNENKEGAYKLTIYKWRMQKGKPVAEEMGSASFKRGFSNASSSTNPNMYGFFLSVGEDPAFLGATTIVGGLSTKTKSPLSVSGFNAQEFQAIRCVDTNSVTDADSPRYTCGAFGVLSKNCSAQFYNPSHYDAALATGSLSGWSTKDNTETFKGWRQGTINFRGELISDNDKLADDWDFVPGRIEKYQNKLYYRDSIYGFCASTNVSQTVDVFLADQTSGDGDWTLVTNINVTSYGFQDYAVQLCITPDTQIQLATGEGSADITVHNIRQTSWRGEDIPNIDAKANTFVYTQARVYDHILPSSTNRYTTLQPSRAIATSPLSIRSPILKGLGMIGFSYRDVQPGCEVWVQISTNNVAANMSALNRSLTEGKRAGEWETLRKITYEELAIADVQTVYFGFHTSITNPNALRGVIRLLINPQVVTDAATNPDRSYGSITLTDVWVQDEPGIDTTCWWAWNFRTVGDASDSEGRMYLPDGRLLGAGQNKYGLSGALNNSTSVDIEGDPKEYAQNNPFIQSPTLGTYTNYSETGTCVTNKAGFGLIRFRARLYDRSTTQPAHVSIYGVLDGNTTDWGSAITNLEINSTSYKEYEFRVPGKGRKFSAVRFVIDGVIDGVSSYTPRRLLIDDIVLTEKTDVELSFVYARPFRSGLGLPGVISDIFVREQQPLTGESWGLQAKLQLPRLGSTIDTNRGFRVTFRYFVGKYPWGYENWSASKEASDEVELLQVGEPSELVFRSSLADPAYRDTVVKAQDTPGTVVQYVVTAYYYTQGEEVEQDHTILASEWTNPAWYAPIDLNEELGSTEGTFSPYTILDNVAPGRAWINEVNYNDGSRKETGTSTAQTDQQFIEIAVPWGVDLSGWKVKVTDMNHNLFTIATLGRSGVKSMKRTANRSGDYDFLVLQNEETKSAGKLRYPDGTQVDDGTWTSDSPSSCFRSGAFRYGQPYEISLYRKSGIMEHQFVIAGTNEYRGTSYGYMYDGTNLVAELKNLVPEMSHFYAGEDVSRWTDKTAFASLGVTGSYHGEEGGWASMTFTPGRLNMDQKELTNWLIKSNGTNIWIYARVEGSHLEQKIGDDTERDTFVIVPSGASTNILYTIARWYEINSLTINGVTNTAASGAKGSYDLQLTKVTNDLSIVATEGIRRDIGIDPNDRYTPAIMRWLENGKADGQDFEGEDITTNNYFLGLWAGAQPTNLTTKAMYWLDLDPTCGGWWFRAGMTDFDPEPVYRKRVYNYDTPYEYTVYYTNREVQMTMYVSNALDLAKAPFAPKRFQGLGNEQSDTFGGVWTSENFKVTGMLINQKPMNAGFLPVRWFIFGAESFYPADSTDPENPPFSARIEILDPFCETSPGYSYGWYGYGQYPVWFGWGIDSKLSFTTIEMLNKNSTYDKQPFQSWDGHTP